MYEQALTNFMKKNDQDVDNESQRSAAKTTFAVKWAKLKRGDTFKQQVEEIARRLEEERKAAEEHTVEEERKAAEEKAAEEKAAEERKAAEEKAAEERKAAEKKAEEERRAAANKSYTPKTDLNPDKSPDQMLRETMAGRSKAIKNEEDDSDSESALGSLNMHVFFGGATKSHGRSCPSSRPTTFGAPPPASQPLYSQDSRELAKFMHNMVWEVASNAGFATHALVDTKKYEDDPGKARSWRTWRVATKCNNALDLLQMLLEDHLGVADHD